MRYLTPAAHLKRSRRIASAAVLLHGYGEGAPLDIFDALTRHGPLRSMELPTYKDRFVILTPQLPVRGDLWCRYADTVRQIVFDEAKKFACDLRRLYLTGFSFGANGVSDLSFGQTAMWAALWPVDPTRVPTKRISRPIWLSLGEISRYQRAALFAHWPSSQPERHRQPTGCGPMQVRIMLALPVRRITMNGFTAGS